VPFDEPSWWYRSKPTTVARLLRPAGALYAWAGERRISATKPYRAALPVVCVGNFTAGGTGKTPLSLYIADELRRFGMRPVFLTRGYGGRCSGPRWVDSAVDRAHAVGDEALLLASRAPTLVACDRARGAREIEKTACDESVIVMDDGLQNPALAKNLSIAVVDARRGVGNGEVLPAGPLRAPLAAQIGRVDLVVVSRPPGDQTGEAWRPRLPFPFSGPILGAEPRAVGDLGWIAGAPILAYAAIANPQRFFDLLARHGGNLVETVRWRDHHAFADEDAEHLLALADHNRAVLATTEKDWMRLLGAGGVLGELRARSRVVPIRLAFSHADAGHLAARLEQVIPASRAPASAANRR
jgi:tetraacyldisaccharide 4'-kinase